MIRLSKGGVLHGFFENSITEFLEKEDVYKFFGSLPRNDCQLFWGLIRNSVLYALVYWTVFIVPLLFITLLSIPFTDIWLLYTGELGYTIASFFHYPEVGFIVNVLIMVLPMAVTTCLLLFVFALFFCFVYDFVSKVFEFFDTFIKYNKPVVKESKPESKFSSMWSLLKVRWDGIKNRYCTPVEWVEK